MQLDVKKEIEDFKRKEKLIKKMMQKDKEVKQKEAIYLKAKKELDNLFKDYQGKNNDS